MLDLERNNEILQKIAAKLRLLRRKAGLLQKTVSAETGLNMGHLEGARKNVTLTTLERWCEYYNITLDERYRHLKRLSGRIAFFVISAPCLPGLFLKSPFAAWRSGLAVTAVPVGAGSRK